MFAIPLYRAGLLQFGVFHTANGIVPYRLRLELLAAYPSLLKAVADEIHAHLANIDTDQIVSAPDAIPLSSVVSSRAALPLVYSSGCGEAPTHDLVGSYDVGHPAVLITNAVNADTERLILRAGRVGLDIHTVHAVVDAGYTLPADIALHAVLSLPDILAILTDADLLSAHQQTTVLASLANTNAQP